MSTPSRAVRKHAGDTSLTYNKDGEIVSARKSEQEKAKLKKKVGWVSATQQAMSQLKRKMSPEQKKKLTFDDYIPKKGTELYKLAKKIHG
jgi:hypothetical protein